jgi:glutamate dehydrogenase/leucine dehydrogenase
VGVNSSFHFDMIRGSRTAALRMHSEVSQGMIKSLKTKIILKCVGILADVGGPAV